VVANYETTGSNCGSHDKSCHRVDLRPGKDQRRGTGRSGRARVSHWIGSRERTPTSPASAIASCGSGSLDWRRAWAYRSGQRSPTRCSFPTELGFTCANGGADTVSVVDIDWIASSKNSRHGAALPSPESARFQRRESQQSRAIAGRQILYVTKRRHQRPSRSCMLPGTQHSGVGPRPRRRRLTVSNVEPGGGADSPRAGIGSVTLSKDGRRFFVVNAKQSRPGVPGRCRNHPLRLVLEWQ